MQLPWRSHGVDVALECTGKFTKRAEAAKHIEAGVKRVLVSAPADGADLTVVMGVNHEQLIPEHKVVSNGSQREERLEVLDSNMLERGIDQERYAWYRDLRRYGTVPHAGFGLGFERTLAYVTGLPTCATRSRFRERPETRGIKSANGSR